MQKWKEDYTFREPLYNDKYVLRLAIVTTHLPLVHGYARKYLPDIGD